MALLAERPRTAAEVRDVLGYPNASVLLSSLASRWRVVREPDGRYRLPTPADAPLRPLDEPEPAAEGPAIDDQAAVLLSEEPRRIKWLAPRLGVPRAQATAIYERLVVDGRARRTKWGEYLRKRTDG
jgi:hypothetical protein